MRFREGDAHGRPEERLGLLEGAQCAQAIAHEKSTELFGSNISWEIRGLQANKTIVINTATLSFSKFDCGTRTNQLKARM